MDLKTIIGVFKETINNFGDRDALVYKKNDEWNNITWDSYYGYSKIIAHGLLALGLKPGEGVAIMGFNSPEWFIANMATIMAGGVVVGCYTTNSPEICEHILNDSNSKIIIVENDNYLQKILSIKKKTKLQNIIYYGNDVNLTDVHIYSWAEFLNYSYSKKDENSNKFIHSILSLRPTDCCTLIYTSGTTGLPKGVQLSHDNIIWTTKTVVKSAGLDHNTIERVVSYLPLSHVAAQMIDIYMPLVCAAETWFAQPGALKGSLGDTLNEAHPTIFLGVPRVWEKLMDKIQENLKNLKGLKKTISQRAKELSKKQQQQQKSLEWKIYNELVYKKVRKAMGLSECKLFLTGAAPITKEVLEYFASLNILICDIYGMSECSGPMSISYKGCYKLGSSGMMLEGTQLKIDEKTGEICTKGRHVMLGYLNQPEKTREVIDNHGWLHSGDIGKLDGDGFLYVVGRIKELIVTSGGENIPPIIIEDNLKAELSFISNCMVIGDKKNYLTILITLKSNLDQENNPTDMLDNNVIERFRDCGSNSITVTQAINDVIVLDIIQKGINNVNKRSISNAHNVQKFKILPVDFSIKGSELGPTLKLKRNVVLEKYKYLIDSMY